MASPDFASRKTTDAHSAAAAPALDGVRLGIDIVQISRIQASIDTFGERFTGRFFTAGEIAYAAEVPGLAAQRFAARFAAKEAAIKAFDWSEAGIDWRDVEVCKRAGGGCELVLHRRAAALAGAGLRQLPVSLSHDGDYATAVVAARAP